jgi:hypothetical protein
LSDLDIMNTETVEAIPNNPAHLLASLANLHLDGMNVNERVMLNRTLTPILRKYKIMADHPDGHLRLGTLISMVMIKIVHLPEVRQLQMEDSKSRTLTDRCLRVGVIYLYLNTMPSQSPPFLLTDHLNHPCTLLPLDNGHLRPLTRMPILITRELTRLTPRRKTTTSTRLLHSITVLLHLDHLVAVMPTHRIAAATIHLDRTVPLLHLSKPQDHTLSTRTLVTLPRRLSSILRLISKLNTHMAATTVSDVPRGTTMSLEKWLDQLLPFRQT